MAAMTVISTRDVPSHAVTRRGARPAPTDPLGLRFEGNARVRSPMNPRRRPEGTEDRAEVWHMVYHRSSRVCGVIIKARHGADRRRVSTVRLGARALPAASRFRSRRQLLQGTALTRLTPAGVLEGAAGGRPACSVAAHPTTFSLSAGETHEGRHPWRRPCQVEVNQAVRLRPEPVGAADLSCFGTPNCQVSQTAMSRHPERRVPIPRPSDAA